MTSTNMGFPLALGHSHLWERYFAVRDGDDQKLTIAYLELLLSGTIDRLLGLSDTEATQSELLRERGERVVRERTGAGSDTAPLPKFLLPPFVRHIVPGRCDPRAYDWWDVEPSDDKAADVERGIEYFHMAAALDQELHETSGQNILALVVDTLFRKGRMTGVECGFLHWPLQCGQKASLSRGDLTGFQP
jgi:hypothetical protein